MREGLLLVMDTEIKKCPECGNVCAKNQCYCAHCGHNFDDYDFVKELFQGFDDEDREYFKTK
jgi:uncharacterized membrane protein YvbJ